MASVASSATSSAPGGGGPVSTAARSPPRIRRSRTRAAGAHRPATPTAAAERPALDQVEGDQLDLAVGLPAGGAGVEHGRGAFEHERLEEEGGGHEGRVGAGSASARRAPHQHRVEPRVGVALLGQLVGHLEQRQPLGHPVEVLAHVRKVSMTSAWLTMSRSLRPCHEQEGHVGERLEPGPELARGPPHALGHRPHLAVPLGQEHDDAVGLAQPVGAQHHPGVAEQAHPAPPSGDWSRACRRASSRARFCASWAGRVRAWAMAPCEFLP